MIREKFYVDNDNRFYEVKTFIRDNMPTARSIENPFKYKSGKWCIYISYEISAVVISFQLVSCKWLKQPARMH